MTGVTGFTERAFNAALGLSLLVWTFRRAWPTLTQTPSAASDFVELTLVAITLLVALLVMTRSPVRREGSWQAIGLALPTVGLGAVAFHGVAADSWSTSSATILAVGAGLTATAFLSLGKSFAVLPSLREVKVRGPYRWVRHPAYAGELIMLAACVLAERSVFLLGIWLAAMLLITPRILAEERLLLSSESYAVYKSHVKYRLVPGVW